MVTYYIQRFIHSVIRDNKLFHIMEMLIGEDTKEDLLLDDLVIRLKAFLLQDHEDIFDDYKLKYLIFLEDFRKNIDEMKDLKDTDVIKMNSILFRIYELPKKRNNLLVIFLSYFYMRNTNKLSGKEIFRMIHIYLMIISYRNRLPDAMRSDLLNLDTKEFRSVGSFVHEKIRIITRKYRFLKNTAFLYSLGFIAMSTGVYCSYSLDLSFLQADVLASSGTQALGKVALDSLFLGRITDSIFSSVQGVGMQNILIIAVFALAVQAMRNSLTNIFFNSLLAKFFEFLTALVKTVSHVVFALYNYAIYKIETRFIFSSIHTVVGKSVVPNAFLLSFFLLVYVLIYFGIIGLYVLCGLFIAHMNVSLLYVSMGALFLSALLIYMNLRSDIHNFQLFLLEIENILKELTEAKSAKKDDKKEEVIVV